MAKLVLVRFEDDTEANILSKAVETGDIAQLDSVLQFSKSAEVVGEYKEPTKFCECPPEVRSKEPKTSKRGRKYGWWIRPCCGRPSKVGGQRPYNLLELAAGRKPWRERYGVSINADW
jgi:hypothetical protein